LQVLQSDAQKSVLFVKVLTITFLKDYLYPSVVQQSTTW